MKVNLDTFSVNCQRWS